MEPSTFRFVAQWLNQPHYLAPSFMPGTSGIVATSRKVASSRHDLPNPSGRTSPWNWLIL
jgi:hypothetical protein